LCKNYLMAGAGRASNCGVLDFSLWLSCFDGYCLVIHPQQTMGSTPSSRSDADTTTNNNKGICQSKVTEQMISSHIGGMEASEEQKDLTNNKKNRRPLKSFEEIDQRCAKKKHAYQNCFNHWWRSSFVAGKLENSRDDCDELFENYQKCYLRGVKEVKEHRARQNIIK